jgi:hypothetical protein
MVGRWSGSERTRMALVQSHCVVVALSRCYNRCCVAAVFSDETYLSYPCLNDLCREFNRRVVSSYL